MFNMEYTRKQIIAQDRLIRRLSEKLDSADTPNDQSDMLEALENAKADRDALVRKQQDRLRRA